jgi:hypothetical protein
MLEVVIILLICYGGKKMDQNNALDADAQERKLRLERKAELRLTRDKKGFKLKQDRDEDGKCIPPYGNYTATSGKKAPAWEILADPRNANKTYTVTDARGVPTQISLVWLAGMFDGEGTLAVYLNRNRTLRLKFQIQPSFVIVQGFGDYYLLTAIAEFLGFGTVSVNRTDATSTRYQIRIVDSAILRELIIPLLKICPLLTKKKDEFIIWADVVEQLADGKANQNWPTNMLKVVEGLRDLKYVGSATKQSLDYLTTCDELEANIKNLPNG